MRFRLGAGFFPVNKGAKTKVRRAISNYQPGGGRVKQGFFTRSGHWVRWISRPILLSFRNTFRKKGRLLLTIFTLTIAGAVFIGVFNVRASMDNVMNQLYLHFMGDVTINFSQPYNTSKVARDLLAVPGITSVEGWGGASGEILDQDDEVVADLMIVAPPQDTQLLDLNMAAGRWLLPDEEKAMVISDAIYDYYPDLEPGDSLIVEIPGNREEEWEVVGIYSFVSMFGDPMAYANFDYVADKINLPNQASSFRIITEPTSQSMQSLIQHIDRQLEDQGYAGPEYRSWGGPAGECYFGRQFADYLLTAHGAADRLCRQYRPDGHHEHQCFGAHSRNRRHAHHRCSRCSRHAVRDHRRAGDRPDHLDYWNWIVIPNQLCTA